MVQKVNPPFVFESHNFVGNLGLQAISTSLDFGQTSRVPSYLLSSKNSYLFFWLGRFLKPVFSAVFQPVLMSSVSIVYYPCLTNPRQIHFVMILCSKKGSIFLVFLLAISGFQLWLKKKKLVRGENINININQGDLLKTKFTLL